MITNTSLGAKNSGQPATMKTHYDILNVSPIATLDEIKVAHRKLALKYHPDKHDRTKTRIELNFHRIQEAWECLRDSEKRQEYDHILSRTKENINKERVENGTTVHVNLSEMDVEECEVEVKVEVEEEGCNNMDERKKKILKLNISMSIFILTLIIVLKFTMEDDRDNGRWHHILDENKNVSHKNDTLHV